MGQDFAESECRRKYLDEDEVHVSLRSAANGIPPTELAYCKPVKDCVTAFCNLFDETFAMSFKHANSL